ncbi:MAG: hypothetical protein ACRD72_19780, partial [Candidatus Angelobacter sp.]
MRDYGKIHSRFWTGADIAGLSNSAKLTALYLLTCEHSNALGCYTLPLAYAAFDLGTAPADLRHDLAELDRIGFALHDEEAEFVFVRHFLKFNPIENGNQGKAIASLFDSVPPSSWIYEPLVDAVID